MAESSAGRFSGIAVSMSLFVAAEDTVFVMNCFTSLSCDGADFGRAGFGRRGWPRGPEAIEGMRAGKGHALCRRLCGRQGAAGSGTDAICIGRPETTQNFVLGVCFSTIGGWNSHCGRCAMWLVCGCVYALLRSLRQRPASWLFVVGGITV